MYAGLCIYAGCKGQDEAINMALSIVGHAHEVFTKDKEIKDEDIPF
jgi:hypothetical protein